MLGWAAVHDVDWKCLFHAYGVADDTPDHLRNLTGQDVKAREAALDHLIGAVVHQSSSFTVTPAAVRVVAGLLGEPVLREPISCNGINTIMLARVFYFFFEVGDGLRSAGRVLNYIPPPVPVPQLTREEVAQLSCGSQEAWDRAHAVLYQAEVELREMAGEIMAAILPSLSDSAPDVRREAAAAIAEWGALEPHSASAHAAADVIRGHLERSTDPEERSSLAEALKALGRDASQWLDD